MNIDKEERFVCFPQCCDYNSVLPLKGEDRLTRTKLNQIIEKILILAKNTNGLERATWLRCAHELYLRFPVGMLRS